MAGFSNSEEPDLVIPLPFPHPFAEVSDSPELELTPEKGEGKRKGIKATRQTLVPDDGENISLCAPKLNSTAQLYKQLQVLRTEWCNARETPLQCCAAPTSGSISTSKPLKVGSYCK